MVDVISLPELRRHVVAWQGFLSRTRRAADSDVEQTIRRLSCVQLDSISTVERSHRIVLGCRAGLHPPQAVFDLVAQGRLIEYWAHEACLIPAEDHRLFRWRMRAGGHWSGMARALREHPEVVDHVLGRIREEGPFSSRDFDGAGGGMWDWKPAKSVLEALWDRGELAVAGRRNGFQRLYDLAERVIPREHLQAPEPPEDELLRQLALRAVTARGALTEAGIVEHYRLPGGVKRIRPRVDELVEKGLVERLGVEDGGPDVLVPAGAERREQPDATSVLLSPFDNLLWDRPFAERLFGFRHVMEIYKPAPQRVYGYYVLPFLRSDRIVGRADLKADRKAGVLRVLAFHPEPGVRDSAALRESFDRALRRLARVARLERVEVLR